MVTAMTQIRQLPLHAVHERLGARFAEFGEWEVPIYYSGIIDEHHTVRTKVGMFDICHMGEFCVTGQDAEKVVNHWITNDVRKLYPGRAVYSPVCNPSGGVVDDVVVMRISADQYLIVVNAGNVEKDFSWFESHLEGNARLENKTAETGLIAVQGPLSGEVIDHVFKIGCGSIRYYHFAAQTTEFGPLIFSATGYTGEKGFEIFCPMEQTGKIWDRLLDAGQPFGIKPVGFGARDTLRLEAKMCLYGHELTDETTPLEAGLDWTIAWDKEDFIGKEALVAQKKNGISRKLVGFEMMDRGIPRSGCVIKANGTAIGHVTSGSFSPTLQKNIGLAYIAAELGAAGHVIEIEIREKSFKAKIVEGAFYSVTKKHIP